MSETGIFVRPPGSEIFWIDFRDLDGIRRREKSKRPHDRQAARELLAKRKAEVKSGEYVPPRDGRVWTFRKLAKAAIKAKSVRLAKLTVESDQYKLTRILRHTGSMRSNRFTTERIDAFLASLRGETPPLSFSTCNRYRAFISSVYTFAVKAGHIPVNPVAKVERFKENPARVRWLSDEEEPKLRLDIFEDVYNLEVDLALHTGMRRGEQFSLRWTGVDYENKVLACCGKTGPRKVKANLQARQALAKLQEVSGEMEFVIPDANKQEPGTRDRRTWFEEACVRARVKNFHWHDLRHTFASRLVMAGTDLITVMNLLGHKDIRQTQKYSHLAPGHEQKAVEKMGTRHSDPKRGRSS